VSPRTSSLPPTLFYMSGALQAPTMSPAFVRRAIFEPQNAGITKGREAEPVPITG